MNEDKYLLSSVSNALRILDLLSEEELLGVAEISKRLKLGLAAILTLVSFCAHREGLESRLPKTRMLHNICFSFNIVNSFKVK